MVGKSDPLDSQSSFLFSVLLPGAMQIGLSVGLWYMNLQYNEQSKQLSPFITIFFLLFRKLEAKPDLRDGRNSTRKPCEASLFQQPQLNPHSHPHCHAAVGTGIRFTVLCLSTGKKKVPCWDSISVIPPARLPITVPSLHYCWCVLALNSGMVPFVGVS